MTRIFSLLMLSKLIKSPNSPIKPHKNSTYSMLLTHKTCFSCHVRLPFNAIHGVLATA